MRVVMADRPASMKICFGLDSADLSRGRELEPLQQLRRNDVSTTGSSRLTLVRLELTLADARYRTRPVRGKGFARLFDIRRHAIHRTSFGLLSGHRRRRRMLCPASISNITANKRVRC